MKVIIAGSRHMPFSAYPLIAQAIERCKPVFEVTEVVCGEAAGADTYGKKWAYHNKIPVKSFPADWETYGKGAGPIRNRQMAEYADALIVFIWDGSRGSANMLKTMQNLNKPCYVVYNGEIND